MNKSSIVTVIVVALLVVVGLLIFGGGSEDQQPAPDQNGQMATTTESTSTPSEATTTSEGEPSTPPPATTQNEAPEETSTTSTPSGQQSSEDTSEQSQTVTVTYTEDGFSPQTVEVSQGDTVQFVNESENDMWVGSDQHPTHTQYDGTSLREHCPEGSDEAFDQCENGDEYSFTFEKTGSWSYHNHSRASDGGTVIVQ